MNGRNIGFGAEIKIKHLKFQAGPTHIRGKFNKFVEFGVYNRGRLVVSIFAYGSSYSTSLLVE